MGKLKRKNFKIISKFLCFMMIIQSLFFHPITALATTNTNITFSTNGDLMVGETIEILVNVNNAQNLYGGSVDFIYDPLLIEITSIENGTLFNSTNVETPVKSISNGQASIGVTLPNSSSGISGSGTLAVINAKILKEGALNLKTTTSNSPLSLTDNTCRIKLEDKENQKVNYTVMDNNLTFIQPSPLSLEEINTDKPSPQLTNSTVRISPSVTGGNGEYTYKFSILKQDTDQWDVVQDFSTKEYFDWTPKNPGNYNLWVDVKDETGKMVSKDIPFTIDSFIFNSIETDKPSPQQEKTTIRISPNVSDGSGNLSYRFWIFEGNTWSVVQDFSSKNYYDWTPKKPGNYEIWVEIKDKTSNNTWTIVSMQIPYSITPVSLVISGINTDKTSPHPAKNTIRITPDATGSGTLTYKFWILKEGTGLWQVVQDFSSKNYYDWTPDTAGNYKLWVDVKDSTGNMISKEIPYVVSAPLAISSINTDKSSPQLTNSKIRITPSVTDGKGDYTYKFWLLKQGTGKWDVVQDFSSKNYYDWSPSITGNYKLWVDVKDETGRMISKEIPYSINSFIFNKIETDIPSPTLDGSTIKISANTSSDTGSLSYKFWILKQGTGNWDVVQDFSSKNDYNWSPKTPGNYTLWIDVKDKSGNMISKQISYTINPKSLSITDITTDKESPFPAKTTIRITPNVTGSVNLTYKFWILKQGTGKWDVVQDFSSKNYYDWTPDSAGNYKLWVDVKDNSGNMLSKEIPFVASAPLAISTINTDKSSPQLPNSTVRISPNVTGGKGDYTYKFWVLKQGTGKWDVVQDFSSKDYYDWTPTVAGNYKLWVDIKDETGRMISKEIPYSIDSFIFNTIETDMPSPSFDMSTIKISANTSGDTSSLSYKFWVLKQGTGQWDVVQDFSSKNYYDWCPETPGNYTLWVDVKDKSGNMVSKQISYTVKPTPLSIDSVFISETSPRPAKDGIIIWPRASGSGTLLYRFWIYNGYYWKVVQDFSTDDSFFWYPTQAGNYKIWIDVKDDTDSMISAEIPFAITEPLTITSINTDKASPQLPNSTIRISPNTIAGEGDYSYKFSVLKEGTGLWQVVQDFSSKDYFDWTPDTTGSYRLWVDVKDSMGNTDSKEISFTINSFLLNSIETDIPSPGVSNSPIRISANTSGDNSSLLYKFWILDGNSWTIAQDFTSSSYYHWTPKKPGQYKIWVDVKSSDGTMMFKEIEYIIN